MFVWGGSFIAIKVGLRYLTPYELLLARFIPSALLLFPIAYLQRKDKNSIGFWRGLSKKGKLGLLAASLLSVPVYHFCLNFGETIIPAGWASLVIALNPAAIIIFSAWLLHEPIGLRRWSGVLLALAGIVYITTTTNVLSDDGKELLWWVKISGVAITMVSVISWGAFTTISKRLITGGNPMMVLAWSIGLGTIFLLPGLRTGFIQTMMAAPSELWWSVIFLSVGCTVIGFVVWFWALNRWSASRAGAFIYLVPLFALLQGRWLLNEPIGLTVAIGAVGVIGGGALAGTKVKT